MKKDPKEVKDFCKKMNNIQNTKINQHLVITHSSNKQKISTRRFNITGHSSTLHWTMQVDAFQQN